MRQALTFLLIISVVWSMGINPSKLVEKGIDEIFQVKSHAQVINDISTPRRRDIAISAIFLKINTLDHSHKNFIVQAKNNKLKVYALIGTANLIEQIISYNITNPDARFEGIVFTKDILLENSALDLITKTKIAIAQNQLDTALGLEISPNSDNLENLTTYLNFVVIPLSEVAEDIDELFLYLTDLEIPAYLETNINKQNKKYHQELEKKLSKQKEFIGFLTP